jgi:hypothetical protein
MNFQLGFKQIFNNSQKKATANGYFNLKKYLYKKCKVHTTWVEVLQWWPLYNKILISNEIYFIQNSIVINETLCDTWWTAILHTFLIEYYCHLEQRWNILTIPQYTKSEVFTAITSDKIFLDDQPHQHRDKTEWFTDSIYCHQQRMMGWVT